MIEGWLAGKLSGIIIFCVACMAPIFLVAWIWEAVALHGIEIPFPIFGPFHLVDGAIHARELAEHVRDKALADLKTCHTNTDTLTAALNKSNASIEDLHRQSDMATAAADARLALETAKRNGLQKQLDKIAGAHIDTSSPGAAAISLDSLIRESAP